MLQHLDPYPRAMVISVIVVLVTVALVSLALSVAIAEPVLRS